MKCHVISSYVMTFLVVLCHFMSCNFKLFHAMCCHDMPCCFMPFHSKSFKFCHFMSCHAISWQALSRHVSRAGHSIFISRFALRSPLISFPWIAIALALIWPIFRFAHRSIALRKTSGSLSEKSAKTKNRS